MSPINRAALKSRLNPGRSISIEHALRMLDLPEKPLDLSPAIDRARAGIRDAGHRDERFTPYCETLSNAFDSIMAVADSAAPDNFRHTIQSKPGSPARSSGLRRSNPWHSVLIEEVASTIEPILNPS